MTRQTAIDPIRVGRVQGPQQIVYGNRGVAIAIEGQAFQFVGTKCSQLSDAISRVYTLPHQLQPMNLGVRIEPRTVDAAARADHAVSAFPSVQDLLGESGQSGHLAQFVLHRIACNVRSGFHADFVYDKDIQTSIAGVGEAMCGWRQMG